MINVKNLSFSYRNGHGTPLRNITFSLYDGDFLLILGESGSGKTTLIRALTGLIPHFYKGKFEGEVIIDGLNTKKVSPFELASKIGVVFQNPENQIITMTVYDELAFSLESRGMPENVIKKKINNITKELGIEYLLERRTTQLSGGELHLVVLASILLLDVQTIILDEPLANLDPWNAIKILSLISKLNKNGKTIILVEHRIDTVLEYTSVNKIAVLHEGKLVGFGSLDILYNENITKYIGVPTVVYIAKKLNLQKKVFRSYELQKVLQLY